MHGSEADVGDDAEKIPQRLTAKVAGPAIAAAAISLGLVLIGACGLGHHDVYVAPPPINADGQVATVTRAVSATSYAVVIPPSPSWHIAARTTPRRTSTTEPFPSYPGDTPTTDPFDEQSFDPPAFITPPTSSTDPYDEQSFDPPSTTGTDPFDDEDTTSVTTDPPSPHQDN
jgi:hypothetical protein